jgi:predicted small lipoprotein YifL
MAGRFQSRTKEIPIMKAKNLLPLMICALALSVTACEKKGPMEKAGQKVDHTADTIKNGGSEPLSDKAQDEADKARDKVNDATGK